MTKMTKAEILREAAEHLISSKEIDVHITTSDPAVTVSKWLRAEADRLEAAQKVSDRIEIAARLAHKAYYQHAAHWDSEQYQIDWRNVACALEAHFAQTAPAEPYSEENKNDQDD